jgi:hypothetical protein
LYSRVTEAAGVPAATAAMTAPAARTRMAEARTSRPRMSDLFFMTMLLSISLIRFAACPVILWKDMIASGPAKVKRSCPVALPVVAAFRLQINRF